MAPPLLHVSRTRVRSGQLMVCRYAFTVQRRNRLSPPSWLTRPASGATGSAGGGQRGRGWLGWFGIPVSLGIGCLAVLQLGRTLRRERRQEGRREPETWQLALFRLLPARLLSRTWGDLTSRDLPPWLRRPLLGLYVWAFGCKMEEAQEEDLSAYSSLLALFTRELKEGSRTVSHHHQLVSPSDGRVLHFGVVENKQVEQVKGVTYALDRFLGPEEALVLSDPSSPAEADGQDRPTKHLQNLSQSKPPEGCCVFHIVIYLAPGDYHHFHSPTDWSVHKRRHFPGELLTVAPWAAKKMPGLFALNERAVLSGRWEHGYFSCTAVGAYNVGSIQLTIDQDLRTNRKGQYKMGEYLEKVLGDNGDGLELQRGDKLGCFSMGSSIVLIFEAPKDFQFLVQPGQQVLFGQPIGDLRPTLATAS